MPPAFLSRCSAGDRIRTEGWESGSAEWLRLPIPLSDWWSTSISHWGQRDHWERLKICLKATWSFAIGSTDNTVTVRTTPLFASIGNLGPIRESLFRPVRHGKGRFYDTNQESGTTARKRSIGGVYASGSNDFEYLDSKTQTRVRIEGVLSG